MQLTTLPPANTLDYSNTDEVCAYQMLLCKLLEQADGLIYAAKQSQEIRRLRSQGHIWLQKVEAMIASILSDHRPDGTSLADLPPLISSYDFLYRICNGTPCDAYIRKMRLQATDLWAKGDRSVTETDLVLMLLAETDRDIRSLDPRYSRYAVTMLGKWVGELTRFGTFRKLPADESYRRLTYLLRADLFVYLGSRDQRRIKQQWVNAHLQNLSTSQPQNLTSSYLSFLLTASHLGYLSGTNPDTLYTSLSAQIATLSDLHPFHKEAIKLDLRLSTQDLAS